MSDTAISAGADATVIHRHPIRGILWGLLMGIGATLVLVVTKVISLDLTSMIIVTTISLLVSVLWSTVGPARAPTGPPPAPRNVVAPQVSRFDDFDPLPQADVGDDD